MGGAALDSLPPTGTGTGIVPLLSQVPVAYPALITVRLEPVAAEILGGGTSSVVPSGLCTFELPPGAVLVTPHAQATSCSSA